MRYRYEIKHVTETGQVTRREMEATIHYMASQGWRLVCVNENLDPQTVSWWYLYFEKEETE